MNLSEEAFLLQAAEGYIKRMGEVNLRVEIIKSVDSVTEKDRAFEAAVNEWSAQADVVIINNQE